MTDRQTPAILKSVPCYVICNGTDNNDRRQSVSVSVIKILRVVEG